MDMYKKSLEDTAYKYERNTRFKNQKNDIKIVATQSISRGKVIYTLCGMTSAIKPEEIKVCFAKLLLLNNNQHYLIFFFSDWG